MPEPTMCPYPPSRCMDDMCRHSVIGLCGRHESDFEDEDEATDDDYENWIDADFGEVGA